MAPKTFLHGHYLLNEQCTELCNNDSTCIAYAYLNSGDHEGKYLCHTFHPGTHTAAAAFASAESRNPGILETKPWDNYGSNKDYFNYVVTDFYDYGVDGDSSADNKCYVKKVVD